MNVLFKNEKDSVDYFRDLATSPIEEEHNLTLFGAPFSPGGSMMVE